MKCPNCAGSELRTVLTRQGVEIDRCDACEGVWLDRGVPGYIFSEDFVMRDETGIIFLDFRQPLAIWPNNVTSILIGKPF